MASFTSTPYTIFFLLPLLLLLHSTTANLVEQTCKNSSLGDPNVSYNFCLNAFRSSPSSYEANLTRLGLISINLARHNSIYTTSLIRSLLLESNNTTTNDEKLRVALKDCLELYSDSDSILREAARDYRSKRMDDANVKVSSVMDDATSCEQGFQDVRVASPLTKQNNCTFQLSAISLSIMDMLS